jgi:hypothetical protein
MIGVSRTADEFTLLGPIGPDLALLKQRSGASTVVHNGHFGVGNQIGPPLQALFKGSSEREGDGVRAWAGRDPAVNDERTGGGRLEIGTEWFYTASCPDYETEQSTKQV